MRVGDCMAADLRYHVDLENIEAPREVLPAPSADRVEVFIEQVT